MQIFCRETKAHLELNPHLREKLELVGSCSNGELTLRTENSIFHRLITTLLMEADDEIDGLMNCFNYLRMRMG